MMARWPSVLLLLLLTAAAPSTQAQSTTPGVHHQLIGAPIGEASFLDVPFGGIKQEAVISLTDAGVLAAVGGETGEVLWRKEVPEQGSWKVCGELVYYVSDSTLYALAAPTGEVLWDAPSSLLSTIECSPSSLVHFTASTGRVVGHVLGSGEQQWAAETGIQGRGRILLVERGSVYLLNPEEGKVAIVSLADGLVKDQVTLKKAPPVGGARHLIGLWAGEPAACWISQGGKTQCSTPTRSFSLSAAAGAKYGELRPISANLLLAIRQGGGADVLRLPLLSSSSSTVEVLWSFRPNGINHDGWGIHVGRGGGIAIGLLGWSSETQQAGIFELLTLPSASVAANSLHINGWTLPVAPSVGPLTSLSFRLLTTPSADIRVRVLLGAKDGSVQLWEHNSGGTRRGERKVWKREEGIVRSRPGWVPVAPPPSAAGEGLAEKIPLPVAVPLLTKLQGLLFPSTASAPSSFQASQRAHILVFPRRVWRSAGKKAEWRAGLLAMDDKDGSTRWSVELPAAKLNERTWDELAWPEEGAVVDNEGQVAVTLEGIVGGKRSTLEFLLDPTTGSVLSSSTKEIESLAAPVFDAASGVQVKLVRAERQHAIASLGRVTGDRSVLYKYLNPHASLRVTTVRSTSTVELALVDAVSGATPWTATINDVDTGKEVDARLKENWVVVSFTAKEGGARIASLEIYQESLGVGTDASRLGHPTLTTYSRTFALPTAGRLIGITTTLQSITSSGALVALASGHVISIPAKFLNARRPLEKPSKIEQEEGLLQYDPMVSLKTAPVISGTTRHILSIEGAVAAPSELESTSLVLLYGLDVIVTAVSPSKRFDTLVGNDGFNVVQLVIAVLVGCVGVLVLAPMAKKHKLSQQWA